MMSAPRISALTTGMSCSAAMQARAKNDMKPSPIPCCFWKRSLCSARSAITALMSISLNVVRIAAVCCAWTRRSAMRRRIGLIATRSSPSARVADGCGAGALGGELHARLVGLELEQDVVGLDRLAVLLRPAHDDPLGHRLAERRDADLERHATLRLRAPLSGRARRSPGRAPPPDGA